ncbi:DNA-directed RNA polymerase subunit H [Candidatus Woesearchaeota archaeon CG10_big_fil_rev_8_21_14_0_10_44_13]|nr:MAG: DNA-directed RNA polymerase subunit H [Candidatus Woesearchaeota archaeon CG10_big_fil_rev_8_21_14_0_10_44_13]
MAKLKVDITKHILIPKHTKLSEKEKKELYEKYGISIKELPKISKDDSAIEHLEVQTGDVIKIYRKSTTAGDAVFYRGVS